jgi:hypothetical protein
MTMETADRIREEALRRMRWRLWFAFRDSKYMQFRIIVNGKLNPNYMKINEYCLRHWGKEIKDMGPKELNRRIALVLKWKE